jgi:hypothetical protein
MAIYLCLLSTSFDRTGCETWATPPTASLATCLEVSILASRRRNPSASNKRECLPFHSPVQTARTERLHYFDESKGFRRFGHGKG